MATVLSGFGGQRGSALLISLVLIFVMTVLGLAFFDLGVLENRLVGASETELRAFEIAQAGIERALRDLRDDMVSDATWANGSPACTSGCVTTEFRNFPVLNNGFNNGTYSLQLKLLTHAEASNNGLNCLPTGVPASALCDDLIFVRSTGQLSGTAGYTPTRTLQVLARANPNFAFGGILSTGVTAGAGSGQPIAGNALIIGTIRVVGNDPNIPPGPSLSFNAAAAGQRNNYFVFDNPQDRPTLDRLQRPDPVCPVPGVVPPCPDAQKVESLFASLTVDQPVSSAAVSVTPGTLGQESNTALYPHPCVPPSCTSGTIRGKGPLDDVFVANGCQAPAGDCSDNFTLGGSGRIFEDDGGTAPWGSGFLDACNGCIALFDLTDSKSTKDHYACPDLLTVLNVPGICDSDGKSEFFTANGVNAATVTIICVGPNPPCTPPTTTLEALLAATNGLGVQWPGNSGPSSNPLPAFTATLPANGISPAGQICGTPGPGAGEFTVVFGSPTCATPTTAANALLIYSNSPVRIAGDPSGPLQRINYTGNAAILSRYCTPNPDPPYSLEVPNPCPTNPTNLSDHGVKIEGIVQTACPPGFTCPPYPRQFPRDDLLTVMTFDNVEIGRDQSGIDRVMGFFATQEKVIVRKQTTIVGAVISRRQFCFAGGCGDNSGNVPRVAQTLAPPSVAQAYLPSTNTTGNRTGWSVSQVKPFWKACVGTGTPGSTTPCDGVTFP